jgi:hypothetical protein
MINEILEFLNKNKSKRWYKSYKDVPIYNWNDNEILIKFLEKNNISYHYHNVNMENDIRPEYRIGNGNIYIAPKGYFKSADSFYYNILHEVIHKIGYAKNTILEYELDEIVAEIGSIILSEKLNLKINKKNSYRYIYIWIDRYIKDNSIGYKSVLKLCYNEAINRINILRI